MHLSGAQLTQAPSGAVEGRVVHPDLAVAQIASRQAGNVTTAQLMAAGLTHRAIARRVASGRLHPRHRGVFLVGHQAEPPCSRQWAAVLACGDGAVVSDRSAVETMELIDVADLAADVDISIPSRSTRRRDGIRVHQRPALERSDTGLWDGSLPIISPALALYGFAADAESKTLERAVAEAFVQQLVTRDDLHDVLERYPRRRGAALLEAVITSDPKLTHRGIEEHLLAAFRRARFPDAEVNVKLHGWEVDFFWRRQKVVVEADSARFHGVPSAVERDRRKDADLRNREYNVLRYSWRQVTEEIEFVIAEIAGALAKSA